MWHSDSGLFFGFLIFLIPVLAIVGGIVSGVVKAIGRQRMIELAYRERMAAIERGLDPSKIPPPPISDDAAKYEFLGGLDWSDHPARRAQGLLIGGIITLFTGMGLMAFLLILLRDSEPSMWAVGLVPALLGIGLLISAWVVRPRNGGASPGPDRPMR